MRIMVAGFQHEGKVFEDQDQLKMERKCFWAEGVGGRDVLEEDKL